MSKHSKVAAIVTIVAIVGMGAYYLVSPLFISTQLNDPLPTGTIEGSYQRFISMNEDEKVEAAKQMSTKERDEIMSTAAQVNNSANEPMNRTLMQEGQQRTPNATTAPNVLVIGSFVGAGDGIHYAEGIAKAIPLQDGSSILRLENLHVTNGPDLYVYLSHDKSASDYVNIGKLKANNGNQNYEIPIGTDLSRYDTVLIWCRPFSVLFGSAELSGAT
jgi:hypothetical protein